MSGSSSQYFSRTPAVDSEEREIGLSLPDLELRFTTDRGVFSNSRVDAGTRLLLQEAPHPTAAMSNVCDLGCGYAAQSTELRRTSPLFLTSNSMDSGRIHQFASASPPCITC